MLGHILWGKMICRLCSESLCCRLEKPRRNFGQLSYNWIGWL